MYFEYIYLISNIAFFFLKAYYLHQILHSSIVKHSFCIKYCILLSQSILFASNIAFFFRKEDFLHQILHSSFAKKAFCIKYCILLSQSRLFASKLNQLRETVKEIVNLKMIFSDWIRGGGPGGGSIFFTGFHDYGSDHFLCTLLAVSTVCTQCFDQVFLCDGEKWLRQSPSLWNT